MMKKIVKIITIIIMIIVIINGSLFFKEMEILNLFGITKPNNNLEYKNFIMKMPKNLEKMAILELKGNRMYMFGFYNLEYSSPIYRNYYVHIILNYIITTGTSFFGLFIPSNKGISRKDNDFNKNDVLGTKYMIHEKVYFLSVKNKETRITFSFSHSRKLSNTFEAYFTVIKGKKAFNKKGALSCDESKNKCFSVYDFNKFNVKHNVKQITEILDKKYYAYTFKIDYNLFIHITYKKIGKEYDNKIYKDFLNSIFEASEKYNEKVNKKDDKDLLKIGSDFWK